MEGQGKTLFVSEDVRNAPSNFVAVIATLDTLVRCLPSPICSVNILWLGLELKEESQVPPHVLPAPAVVSRLGVSDAVSSSHHQNTWEMLLELPQQVRPGLAIRSWQPVSCLLCLFLNNLEDSKDAFSFLLTFSVSTADSTSGL